MKNNPNKSLRFAAAMLAVTGFTQAATITVAGAQLGIESEATNDPTFGWRNTSPAKTLDIDGDNIIGTDGYIISTSATGTILNPGYGTLSAIAPNRNGNFGNIDNPADPSGNDIGIGAWHDNNVNALNTLTAGLVQFTVTNVANIPSGETIRLGILVDLVQNGIANYTLEQTVGGTATATSANYAYGDGMMDVVYFDLTGLSNGDTFVVKALHTSGGTFEQVIGVTLDTGVVVPEPSAALLGGLGLLALLRRRR